MASDISFRDGSLYHAVGYQDYFGIVSALLMTGILMGGLILRQRQGPARIGAESVLLLLIYGGAVAVQLPHRPFGDQPRQPSIICADR